MNVLAGSGNVTFRLTREEFGEREPETGGGGRVVALLRKRGADAAAQSRERARALS